MPLIFIALLIAIQSLLYVTTRKLGGSGRMQLILTACLLTNFILLPWATIPFILPPDLPCGNPAIGIWFGYWVFGTVPILMCHAIFFMLKDRAAKKEKASQVELES